jgi:hypothetical protein
MLAMVPVQQGNDTIVTTAKMPAHWQWQRCHRDEGNDTSLTMGTTPLQQGKQRYCNNGKDALTAKTPAHQRGQHHCNKGNDASSTTAKMPAHPWRQLPNCYKGNNASLMTVLAQLRQRCHCNKVNNHHRNNGKDACTSMAPTPLQRGQQHHCNDGKDTCTLMMTMMPLQQGQQRQLEDGGNAIATRATTPLEIKGDSAIVTRATMLAWQWQGRLRIDNGHDAIIMRATIAIATMAKMPSHQWQWCHHNNSNNASSTTSNKVNNTSSTMAEMPAHWRQQ